MRKDFHRAYLDVIHELQEAYEADGHAALARMKPVEVQALYAELMCELNAVSKKLSQHPWDELGAMRKSRLEAEIRGVGEFIRENQSKRDRGRER